jgi:two-component system response regulator (stage 0 sporulation protein A)
MDTDTVKTFELMQRKIKIVLVDPNDETRENLIDLINVERGFKLIRATDDSYDAYAYIVEHKPDILITDIVLLGEDGLSFIERISQLPASVRPEIIITSGFASEQAQKDATALGVAYFMQKPCDTNTLFSRIRQFSQFKVQEPLSAPETIQPEMSTESMTLEEAVTEILHNFGMPTRNVGYQYVRTAIVLAVEDRKIINALTKGLYPIIAAQYRSTPSRIERSIRHEISLTWDNAKTEILQKYFGINAERGRKPTNGEFIAKLADTLLLKKIREKSYEYTAKNNRAV